MSAGDERQHRTRSAAGRRARLEVIADRFEEVAAEFVAHAEEAKRRAEALAGALRDLARGETVDGREEEPLNAPRRSDGARLVAMQLMVAGVDRELIARRLEDDFGVADTDTILDSIFGEEDEA